MVDINFSNGYLESKMRQVPSLVTAEAGTNTGEIGLFVHIVSIIVVWTVQGDLCSSGQRRGQEAALIHLWAVSKLVSKGVPEY